MMYWAFTIQVNGSRRPPAGLFLMLVGGAGTVVSAIVFRMSRNSEQTHHTFDRQVSNLDRGCRSIRQRFKQLTLRVLSSATTHPPHQEEARARG
jgi:multisubunit Na+/H+ antiporter MnhB subunit